MGAAPRPPLARQMGPQGESGNPGRARAPKAQPALAERFRVPRLRQAREPCARIRLHPLTESDGGRDPSPKFFKPIFRTGHGCIFATRTTAPWHGSINAKMVSKKNAEGLTAWRPDSNAVFRHRCHANTSAHTQGFRFRCIAALSRLTFDAIAE